MAPASDSNTEINMGSIDDVRMSSRSQGERCWTHTLEIKIPLNFDPTGESYDIQAALDKATRSIMPLGRYRSYRFGRDLGLSRRAAIWMARHPANWELTSWADGARGV